METSNNIIFINDWGTNPNERIFYIADFFKKYGKYNTLILGRKYHNMPNRRDLKKINISFLDLDKYPNSRIIRLFIRIILIFLGILFIIKHKPKYVYIRSIYLSLIFGYLSKLMQFKLIYETHGLSYRESIFKRGNTFRTKFLKNIETEVINKLSDVIVTNTKALADNINNEFKIEKTVYPITNGIDLDYFHNFKRIKWADKPDGFIAGFIGNWERWINIEDLLEVSNMGIDIAVVVVGQGKDLELYKEKYPDVYFTVKVPREQALSYLMEFDVCVSPWSNDPIFKEKSARKTFEYLAAGKPIIVSDVPGREEFLIPDENCLLYESGNPTSLYLAIKKLKEDHYLRKNIEKNNKNLTKEFTWEEVVKRSSISEIF
jgi:glycosyltransferase involved in cell wall biosynthesis